MNTDRLFSCSGVQLRRDHISGARLGPCRCRGDSRPISAAQARECCAGSGAGTAGGAGLAAGRAAAAARVAVLRRPRPPPLPHWPPPLPPPLPGAPPRAQAPPRAPLPRVPEQPRAAAASRAAAAAAASAASRAASRAAASRAASRICCAAAIASRGVTSIGRLSCWRSCCRQRHDVTPWRPALFSSTRRSGAGGAGSAEPRSGSCTMPPTAPGRATASRRGGHPRRSAPPAAAPPPPPAPLRTVSAAAADSPPGQAALVVDVRASSPPPPSRRPRSAASRPRLPRADFGGAPPPWRRAVGVGVVALRHRDAPAPALPLLKECRAVPARTRSTGAGVRRLGEHCRGARRGRRRHRRRRRGCDGRRRKNFERPTGGDGCGGGGGGDGGGAGGCGGGGGSGMLRCSGGDGSPAAQRTLPGGTRRQARTAAAALGLGGGGRGRRTHSGGGAFGAHHGGGGACGRGGPMGAPHTLSTAPTPSRGRRRTVAATVPGVVTHAGKAAAWIRFTDAISAQEASTRRRHLHAVAFRARLLQHRNRVQHVRRRQAAATASQTHCPSASSRRHRGKGVTEPSVSATVSACSARSVRPAGSRVESVAVRWGGGDRLRRIVHALHLQSSQLGALRAKRGTATYVVGMRRAARRHCWRLRFPQEDRSLMGVFGLRPARVTSHRSRRLFFPPVILLSPRSVHLPVHTCSARRARAVRGRPCPRHLLGTVVVVVSQTLSSAVRAPPEPRSTSTRAASCAEQAGTRRSSASPTRRARWCRGASQRPPARRARGCRAAGSSARASRGAATTCGSSRYRVQRRPSSSTRDQVGGLEAIEVGLARGSRRRRRRRPPEGVCSTPSRRAPSHCVLPPAPSAHAVLGVALRLCGHPARDDPGRGRRVAARAPPVRVGRRAAVAAAARPPPRRRRLPPYALLLVQLRLLHSDGHIFVPVFPAARSPRSRPRAHEAAAAAARARPRDPRDALAPRRPPRAAFLASLGTAALASIVKRAPELALATTFVDLIRFDSTLATCSTTSMRARASRGARRSTTAAAKARDGEPSVRTAWAAASGGRHWLAPTDLCCDTAVVLSGRDAGLPARDRRVAPRLASPNLPFLAVAHAPSVRGHLLRWASRLKKEISPEVDYRRRGRTAGCLRAPPRSAARSAAFRRWASPPQPHVPTTLLPAPLPRRSYKLSLLSSPLSPLLRASSVGRRRRGPCPPPRASRRRRPAPPRPPTAAAKQPPPPGCRRRRCRRRARGRAICGRRRRGARPAAAAGGDGSSRRRARASSKHTAKGLGVGDVDDDRDGVGRLGADVGASAAWSGYLGSAVDDIESELRWWSVLAARPAGPGGGGGGGETKCEA